MNRLPQILLAAVAIAAIAALAIHSISDNRRSGNRRNRRRVSGRSTNAVQQFSGFNFNLPLNENTRAEQAVGEMTLLQYYINLYYGQPVVPVTGYWNQETAQALYDITGRETTTIYYFRYHYLVPLRGDKEAAEILKALTIN